jgi:hypothetical protein
MFLAVSNKFLDKKLNYIHKTPVDEQIIKTPGVYLWSSARINVGFSRCLEVVMELVKLEPI